MWVPYIFSKKTTRILNFSRLSSCLQTGDEGIEPPPKVLETPIIPFDQSPIFYSDFLKSPYIYTMETIILSITFFIFIFFNSYIYKNGFFNMKRPCIKSILRFSFILVFAFIALIKERIFPQAVEASTEGNWGLSFQEEGAPPVANATFEELAAFDAYYAQDTDEKNLYLTFDAGYENGHTGAILDALKKHNAPATFFVVGTYLEGNPDLIKRMISEGHIVGNHTYHHKDMSQLSETSAFSEELTSVETIYKKITGQEMKKFYRPPQGKYSESNLKMAKDMGYKTFFWSLAYVDWYDNDQPTKEEAFDKLLPRIHPGAIVLLHSTSSTNAEILNELLTKWEEMGYTFHSLDEL